MKRSWKLRFFSIFKYITEMRKILRVYMVLGGRHLKIRDVCMDLEPCFKVFQFDEIGNSTQSPAQPQSGQLSGHPLLSGQLSKSRKLCPLIIVILTSIKRSPLWSGRGHPLLGPKELFLLSWPVLNGHFVEGNHSNMVTNSVPGNWISNDL